MIIELQGVKANWTNGIQKEVIKEFEKLDHAYHKTKKEGISMEETDNKKFKNEFTNTKQKKD